MLLVFTTGCHFWELTPVDRAETNHYSCSRQENVQLSLPLSLCVCVCITSLYLSASPVINNLAYPPIATAIGPSTPDLVTTNPRHMTWPSLSAQAGDLPMVALQLFLLRGQMIGHLGGLGLCIGRKHGRTCGLKGTYQYDTETAHYGPIGRSFSSSMLFSKSASIPFPSGVSRCVFATALRPFSTAGAFLVRSSACKRSASKDRASHQETKLKCKCNHTGLDMNITNKRGQCGSYKVFTVVYLLAFLRMIFCFD